MSTRTTPLLIALTLLIQPLPAFAERTATGGSSSFMGLMTDTIRRAFSGGETLEYKERKGRRRNGNLVSVNGCSQTARFKTHYGNPGGRRGRGPACDRALTMNRHYVEFANKNLESCAQDSADKAFGHGQVSANDGDNAIYHAGCIGDARHQTTGSWHNEGLAWDINAIKIGGKLLKYSDALKDRKVASFYEHFRKCWGEKVAANGKSCRKAGKKGRPAGTIGNEDRRHRHHLHLSLPCKALSNGRATFIAANPFFELLFPSAFADEAEEDADMTEAESQFFTSQLRLPKGIIEVEVEKAPEPVNAGRSISLTLACHKSDEIYSLESDLATCAFDGLRPSGNGQVELSYRVAKMVDGTLSCATPKTKTYSVSCL